MTNIRVCSFVLASICLCSVFFCSLLSMLLCFQAFGNMLVFELCNLLFNYLFVFRINNLLSALRLQGIKLLKCFLIINLRYLRLFRMVVVFAVKVNFINSHLSGCNRLKSLMIYRKIKLSRYTDVVPWLICAAGHIYQIHPL